MNDPVTARVNGTVHKLSRTWAIIEGDNGIHYFMMPTDVTAPHVFRDLIATTDAGVTGTRVIGEPYLFKGRQRMRDVVVVTSSESVHGETR